MIGSTLVNKQFFLKHLHWSSCSTCHVMFCFSIATSKFPFQNENHRHNGKLFVLPTEVCVCVHVNVCVCVCKHVCVCVLYVCRHMASI